jgi:hypothetical protein
VLHKIPLDLGDTRPSVGGQQRTWIPAGLRFFQKCLGASHDSFREILIDVSTGELKASANRCIRVFGVNRLTQLGRQDDSLEHIEVGHIALRTGTKIGRDRYGGLAVRWQMSQYGFTRNWLASSPATGTVFDGLIGFANKCLIHGINRIDEINGHQLRNMLQDFLASFGSNLTILGNARNACVSGTLGALKINRNST